ncbi:MAG: hypothetical protein HY329_28490 [Chloroflexi bacterium]|nr:hypothetical protein [Chloroflexota bacterium]
MSERATSAPGADGSADEPPIPVMQEIYDNVWFLFLASMISVLVFYVIWGLIDLVNVPMAT